MKVMLRAIWPSVNDIRQSSVWFRSFQNGLNSMKPSFSSQPPSRILWHDHTRLYVFLPFLAHFSPRDLVPHSQDVCHFFGVTPDYTRSFNLSAPLLGHDSRHLFTVKSIVTPIAGIVFFIWCIVKAKGVGPIISRPASTKGSDLGWSMLVSLMACISNMATLVTCVIVLSLVPCFENSFYVVLLFPLCPIRSFYGNFYDMPCARLYTHHGHPRIPWHLL